MRSVFEFAEKWYLRVRLFVRNLSTITSKIQLPSPISRILGKSLRFSRNLNEHRLLQIFQVRSDLSNFSIIRQSIQYASRLVVWLLLLFIVSVILDYLSTQILELFQVTNIGELALWSASNTNTSLNAAIISLVQVYIGAIATIFGLFFALYIAGFELSTTQYSRDVANYVNEERVSVFFFKWLLFAIIFNILIVIRAWILETPAIASFVVTTLVSIFSILTTLVYRSHSLLSSRPENIIRSVLTEYRTNLDLVTDQNKPEYKSVSLSKHASNRVEHLCIVLQKLYTDLLRTEDFASASLVPIATTQVLLDYVKKRHLLETELTHWFQQSSQMMRRNDPYMAIILSNYAIRGDASMQLPATVKDWLEAKIYQMFGQFVHQTSDLNSGDKDRVMSGIISAYQTLLYGDHTQDNSKLPGLFEVGAIDEFESILTKVNELISIAKSQRSRAELFNALYFTEQVILAGFDDQEVEISYRLLLTRPLIELAEINKSISSITLRDITISYWHRLYAENVLEGRIITPNDSLKKEIQTELKSREAQLLEKYTKMVIRSINVWMLDATDEEKLAAFRGQLNLIKKAIYHKHFDLLPEFESLFSNEIINLLLDSNPQNIEEMELMYDLDDVCYISLIFRIKTLFQSVTRFRTALFLALMQRQNENPYKNIPLIKQTVSIGALSYGYSELDQEPFWVNAYSHIISQIYPDTDQMIVGFNTIFDDPLTFREGINSSEYRRRWYREFEDELQELNVIYDRDTSSVIPRASYEHLSEFIKGFSPEHRIYSRTEDNCVEGYIEWLKKNHTQLKDQSQK